MKEGKENKKVASARKAEEKSIVGKMQAISAKEKKNILAKPRIVDTKEKKSVEKTRAASAKKKRDVVAKPQAVGIEENKSVETKKRKTEKKNLKVVKKVWGLLTIVLGVIALACAVAFVFWPRFRFNGFRDEIKIEYQDSFDYRDGEVCFGNLIECNEAEISVDGRVETGELGEYRLIYTVIYGTREAKREVIVKVVDETAPVLELTEFEEDSSEEGLGRREEKISVCPNGKIPRIKMKAEDNHDGDLTERIKMEFDDEETVTISVEDEAGNRTEKRVSGVVEDIVAPVITLNGEESKVLVIGAAYTEEGATAEDNCDGPVEIAMEGGVDTSVAGSYEISYKAEDEANNAAKKKRLIRVVNPADGYRLVYLTFDDGPGEHTGRLLDILAKYGVKATFFVTGRGDDSLIKREFDEGHTVALHSYSHNYAYIYANIDNYFSDLYAIRDRVQRITGQAPTIIRFPGGSSNTVSALYDGGTRIMSRLVGEVTYRGFSYADWNISSGDAGGASTAEQVYENVVYRLGDGRSVVLQHDIKGFSVDAVERIIQYGLANGYMFLPMTTDSFMAHHGVNN